MGYAEALGEAEVEAASRAALAAIPDLARAVSELTALKGVGPATASAILAAFAPEIAPFMSDEVGSQMGSCKNPSFPSPSSSFSFFLKFFDGFSIGYDGCYGEQGVYAQALSCVRGEATKKG